MYAGYFYRPIWRRSDQRYGAADAGRRQPDLGGAGHRRRCAGRATGQDARAAGATGSSSGTSVSATAKASRCWHGVRFSCEPGKMTALVGPTGAGKSTLVDLIPRFFDVGGGAVVIDGEDARDVDLTFLRRHIAMVLQDASSSPARSAENIAYGRPEATARRSAAPRRWRTRTSSSASCRRVRHGARRARRQALRRPAAAARHRPRRPRRTRRILILDEATRPWIPRRRC